MIRNIRVALIAVTVLMAGVIKSMSQSLHAIVFCNTIDVKIGCAVDEENMLNELSIIATETGLDYKPYVKHGEACTRGNLIKILDELQCATGDVVFFYYSGHGAHSAQQMNEPFPQMCMKYNSIQNQNEFVSVRTVDDLISKKSPRLSLMVTDCCNNVSQSLRPRTLLSEQKGATVESETSATALKKLFLNCKGKVKITSSKLSQTSGGHQKYGGLFTNAFLDVLADVEEGKVAADWKSVTSVTKKRVKDWSQQKQEPYDVVAVEQLEAAQIPPTPPLPAVNTTETTLDRYLKFLLDKSVSESQKLQLIPTILSECFNAGATVKTVGRNLTTVIEYEDASDFLRRIVASSYIKNIVIVRQADSGKNDAVTVHEIRTY